MKEADRSNVASEHARYGSASEYNPAIAIRSSSKHRDSHGNTKSQESLCVNP
jgi:hypothetical protein